MSPVQGLCQLFNIGMSAASRHQYGQGNDISVGESLENAIIIATRTVHSTGKRPSPQVLTYDVGDMCA